MKISKKRLASLFLGVLEEYRALKIRNSGSFIHCENKPAMIHQEHDTWKLKDRNYFKINRNKNFVLVM